MISKQNVVYVKIEAYSKQKANRRKLIANYSLFIHFRLYFSLYLR
jgi:hypothetical protein